MPHEIELLTQAIKDCTKFCCPYTYFQKRQHALMGFIADELGLSPSIIWKLRENQEIVENTKCLKCKMKERVSAL